MEQVRAFGLQHSTDSCNDNVHDEMLTQPSHMFYMTTLNDATVDMQGQGTTSMR